MGTGTASCRASPHSLTEPVSFEHVAQVVSIIVSQARGEVLDLLRGDVAHAVGHLFDTSDLQALPRFDRLDKVGGLHERFRRAGVEPGKAATEALDAKLAAPEIGAVDVGDFQFAAGRVIEFLRAVMHMIYVHILVDNSYA